jgi:hypothetical protein
MPLEYQSYTTTVVSKTHTNIYSEFRRLSMPTSGSSVYCNSLPTTSDYNHLLTIICKIAIYDNAQL